MKTKLLILLTLTFTCTLHAYAGSATWNLNPVSGDWNDAANWTPETVPSVPGDIASLGLSNITDLFVNNSIEMAEVFFEAEASPYEISLQGRFNYVVLSGPGLVNDSGNAQAFLLDQSNTLQFYSTASAGDLTEISGGNVSFFDNATAASATLTINGGVTNFYDNSTADHAQFVVGGLDVPEVFANQVAFNDESTAADGNFVINPDANAQLKNGGNVWIATTANAGRATFTCKAGQASGTFGGFVTLYGQGACATFICEGSNVAGAGAGVMYVFGPAGSASFTATGGTNGGAGGDLFLSESFQGQTARFIVLGNATMRPYVGAAVGSIEGDGLIINYGHLLITGTNNLSTIFSGIIDSGSLEKVGTGTLKLSGANTYTNGTTVSEGALAVGNTSGSGTGTGPVQVSGGILAGSGTIGGTVTVGTGSGTGSFLTPAMGASKATALTIQGILTFKADATYTCSLNTKKRMADQVIANGLVIESGAQFNFVPIANKKLMPGTVFTVIDNTAATQIAGTFSNLPDGSVFMVGRNTFQASYTGGDGNDLTLTVVP